MKKINIFRRLLWQSMLLAVPVLFLIGFAMRPSISEGSQGGYDINESIAKLKAIGKALQIYRAEYGYLPVEQRKSYKDAGLPPHLAVLYQPGFKWSIPGSNFFISNPNDMHKGPCIHFDQLYLDWVADYENSELYKHYGDLRPFYSQRGEKLPLLGDFNQLSDEEMMNNQTWSIVVLRLDGSVDVIEFKRDSMKDLLSK